MTMVMDVTALRQKLHNYLEIAEDKKVKALYAIMEEDIEESTIEFTPEFEAELDKRYKDYKSGKAKMVTASESKKRIQKLLQAARKK